MKYAIVIPDGCADEPQQALGGRTPLQAASLPATDAVAAAGVVGRASYVPPSLPAGSEVANMSLLGYDPLVYFTGRAPLEAAAQGIELAPEDWAIRCNMVTIENQVMRDFTADHISTDEARQLLEALSAAVQHPAVEFIAGVSYRNLALFRGAQSPSPFGADSRTTPPHDLTDQLVIDHHPRGPGSDLLNQWMSESVRVFADHPVNAARRASGRRPATNVWLWGLGQQPALAPFHEVYGRQGVMITAVDLLRGLAELIGWRRIEVPGATGYTDTDYAAKGRAAVEALPDTDVVCVHVEAPDEASHEGDVAGKVEALEQIDRHIVEPLWSGLRELDEYRILVCPDHPTPLRTKTHSHGAVPLAIAGSDVAPDGASTYDEIVAGQSELSFDDGWKVMKYFLA